MVTDFAGCVHFTGSCDIKVLILLYSNDKKAYLGFIPNDQVSFVDRIRTVIQQQKMGQQQQQLQQQQQQPGMMMQLPCILHLPHQGGIIRGPVPVQGGVIGGQGVVGQGGQQ